MAHMNAANQALFLRLNLEKAAHVVNDLEAGLIREFMAAGRSDFGVLRCLRESGPCSVSEVGRELHLTSGAVTTAIDRVERKGWVVRRHSPRDRRVVTVDLTLTGREVFERTDPVLQDRLESLFSRLDAAERAQLGRLLEKLNRGEGKDRFERAFTAKEPGLPDRRVPSAPGGAIRT